MEADPRLRAQRTVWQTIGNVGGGALSLARGVGHLFFESGRDVRAGDFHPFVGTNLPEFPDRF